MKLFLAKTTIITGAITMTLATFRDAYAPGQPVDKGWAAGDVSYAIRTSDKKLLGLIP